MDRTDLSAAIIADAGETIMTLLRDALPALLRADLADLERHLQGLGRILWGQVVDAIIGLRARDERGAPPDLPFVARLRTVYCADQR